MCVSEFTGERGELWPQCSVVIVIQ